ncbi:CLUMA_CG000272, isoform A [Clunio marinus]|uniref:CLUMA_CG000272, isoform A n=1 Tax=Clunio marinus TaxID=568069 RepID=A0A1J1HEJ2_9DIPT|nr:CLUMA_CG000272, isoform A [Clunio marinus]
MNFMFSDIEFKIKFQQLIDNQIIHKEQEDVLVLVDDTFIRLPKDLLSFTSFVGDYERDSVQCRLLKLEMNIVFLKAFKYLSMFSFVLNERFSLLHLKVIRTRKFWGFVCKSCYNMKLYIYHKRFKALQEIVVFTERK